MIRRRKSTRLFSNQPISKDKIERVLEAARWAPSAKNRQLWRYMVLASASDVQKVSTLLESKDLSVQETAWTIRTAGALILVGRALGSRDEDRLTDYLSIGASVENMLLAATEIGLSSLWICDILAIKDEIKSQFRFSHELVAAVCLGYKDNYDNEKARKSLSEIIDYRETDNDNF